LKEFNPAVLQRRGPDCYNIVTRSVAPGLGAVFYGTVLHFRGKLTIQPLELNGNILVWNGEIFRGFQVAQLLCTFQLLNYLVNSVRCRAMLVNNNPILGNKLGLLVTI